MTEKQDTQGMYFETADDGLAAFLAVKGCRYFGLGIGEKTDPSPVVTHVFDDNRAKITLFASSYLAGERDEVSATRFLAALQHFALQREDQALRLRRQAESDLIKIRVPPMEVPDE